MMHGGFDDRPLIVAPDWHGVASGSADEQEQRDKCRDQSPYNRASPVRHCSLRSSQSSLGLRWRLTLISVKRGQPFEIMG